MGEERKGKLALPGFQLKKQTGQSVFSAPAGFNHGHVEHESSMKRFFAVIFPFDSPAYNSILATFYISS